MLSQIATYFQILSERVLKNPLLRRVVKNSAYLFSASGVSIVISFFQNILVTKLLGVYQFGLLGAIVKFTSVINKLVSFRMNELVVKYVGQYAEIGSKNRAAAVFKVASITEILSSFLSYGLILLIAPYGARLFAKDIETTDLFILYGLIVLANAMFESSTGLLQILDRFRTLAYIQVIQSVVTLGFIALAFITGGGIREVVLAYMAGKAVNGLGVAILALLEATRHWGWDWWRTPITSLKEELRELVRFAVSTNNGATINLVNKDSEELWVSFFRGPLETGYYKQAIALSNLVLLPISPLPQATYPELSRETARKNWQNLRYVLRHGSLLAAIYTATTALGLVAIGRPLIAWLYDPEFLPAYPALVILLIGLLVANTFYWNRSALLSLNLPDYPTKVNGVSALLKISLAVLLIPRFGYLASAALLSGYYILSIGMNVRRTYRELQFREQLGSPN